MRSKNDGRTDKEREIDAFLSQFDNPDDESSLDYDSYLEPADKDPASGQTFSWKDVRNDKIRTEITPEDLGIDPDTVEPGFDPEPEEEPEHEMSAEQPVHDEADIEPEPESEPVPEETHIEPEPESVRDDADIVPEPDPVRDDADIAPETQPVHDEADIEPEPLEPEPAAYHYVSRKTRRTKDIRLSAAEKSALSGTSDPADVKADNKKRKSRPVIQDSNTASDAAIGAASGAASIAAADAAETVSEAASAEKPDIGRIFAEKIAESKKAVKKKKKRKKKPAEEDELKSDTTVFHRQKDAPDVSDTTEKTDEEASDADKPEGSSKDTETDTVKKSVKKTVKKPVRKIRSAAARFKGKAGRLVSRIKAVKGDRTLAEFLFLKKNPDYDPSQGDTYVKDGKTIKNRKNKVSIRKILLDIAALFVMIILCGAIYAIGCILTAPKYNYKDIYSAVDTASVVYDDQEQPIDNVFYTENRKVITYKDMPEDLINSFVAIEDKTFWKHHGFNWTRMIGAILSALTGNGKISGTSTITQQLARNVYLADTKSVRSIKRKLLEMYYAARLEHSLSKEEIIEAYLNTIYLGHGCYGVNAAARTYFSKDVKDLELAECAALAALPQSPDTYALLKLGSEAQEAKDSKVVATEPDTIVTNDISRERRQLTLDLMLEQGMITQEEHDKVYDLKLNDFIDPSISSTGSVYSYFHEYLVDTIIADLMDERGMSYEDAERMVYTKGLQIYSTIDSTAQKIIVDEFKDESNFPYITAPLDEDGNMLNSEGKISLYKYDNDFDEDGNFTLRGEAGDVSVNNDGSVTINKGHKLHIYETEVEEGTDYSLEFKPYYLYDDEETLYTISGGYVNIPMGYKSLDADENVVISADLFSDPDYSDNVRIDGKDLILKPGIYTLSSKSRQPQAAMTIVGVGTGEVKAMVGGRTSGGQKLLNRSLNSRQPGSSIKPLAVYGAALQKSYDLKLEGKKWKFTDFGIDKQGTKGWGDYVTTHSSIEDERTKLEGRYWPNNFNNSFSGKNTFMTAIQKSINTCAVKLELQVGDDYSVNQLKRFGLTTVNDDTSNPVNDVNPAALALGAMTQGVQPLEMALAYASFPAGGKVNTPICYYKVLDRNGDVLLEGKSEQSEALNEGVAWIMTNVLQSVVKANNYMYVSDVQPGGKTGTTNDQYDIWFDGFTPSYAASLWIGTDENVEMSSMSTPAANLWGKIMNQIPNAKTGEYLPQPDNVIYTAGNYFTKGTETGLTSWSDAEAKKQAEEKAKKAAYEKWLKEREKHKVLVPEVVQEVDDPSQPIYENQIVGYEKMEQQIRVPKIDEATGQPVVDPVTGEPVFDVITQMVDDPSRPIYQNVLVGYKKKPVVVQEAHYEYEKGWRDGDFKYKGD